MSGIYNGRNVTDKTVAEVLELIKKDDIPETATFEYVGCGSHEVEIVWYTPVSTPGYVEDYTTFGSV